MVPPTDLGFAVRPLDDWQSLEFRLGNKLSEDFRGGGAKELVYAAVRINFGLGAPALSASGELASDWASSDSAAIVLTSMLLDNGACL